VSTESYEFKSEARQLLDLMIHSLYSNKEIFLRELISNASDALDKLRVEALKTPELVPSDHPYRIRIWTDPEARTLTVEDSGVGMSRAEAIDNLGTIARSGTREFLKQLAEAGDAGDAGNLIGQFGVGFYSSFMVSDRVEVITRRAGEEGATCWRSTGDGTFTIDSAERAGPGTTVVLHLREGTDDEPMPDMTDAWIIKSTVKKYSDFVTWPIEMSVPAPDSQGDEEGEDAPEDGGGDEEAEPRYEAVNSQKAIWSRSESQVDDEEYDEFYKHISHDWNKPFHRVRIRAEGTFEYTALLFVPSTAPHDLYMREVRYGLQLYAQRVMIMERNEDLLPLYLRFVRGVVESPDLPLNVSREILQKDRRVEQIRKRIVKKVLDALGELQKKERDRYLEFWSTFGRVLKEGLPQDRVNKERITELLLFPSTEDPKKLTTLAEYVERMPDEQEAIYYITGESRSAVENSPHLEAFRDKGYEVLLLTEAIDEIVVDVLPEFQGKKLQSVGRGTVELGSEEERKEAEEAREKAREEHASLLEAIQEWLDEWIKEVRLSTRLTSSAVCLVGDEGDLSPGLQRMLEATGQELPSQKHILEVNADHPILATMGRMYEEDRADARLRDYARLLYGQALLAEGRPPPDPVAFGRQVAELMVRAAAAEG
jgi:molecular chaperone HtpG